MSLHLGTPAGFDVTRAATVTVGNFAEAIHFASGQALEQPRFCGSIALEAMDLFQAKRCEGTLVAPYSGDQLAVVYSSEIQEAGAYPSSVEAVRGSMRRFTSAFFARTVHMESASFNTVDIVESSVATYLTLQPDKHSKNPGIIDMRQQRRAALNLLYNSHRLKPGSKPDIGIILGEIQAGANTTSVSELCDFIQTELDAAKENQRLRDFTFKKAKLTVRPNAPTGRHTLVYHHPEGVNIPQPRTEEDSITVGAQLLGVRRAYMCTGGPKFTEVPVGTIPVPEEHPMDLEALKAMLAANAKPSEVEELFNRQS